VVSSRAAKYTYGIETIVPFFPWDSEHWSRIDKAFKGIGGHPFLGDAFSSILSKGERVSETQEFARSYSVMSMSPSTLSEIEVEILAYSGAETAPQWMDEEKDSFSTLCTIRADTSAVTPTLHPQRGQSEDEPGMYWTVECDVVLLFGLTELQAQLKWTEEGVEKRSTATVIYDEREEWE